VLSGALVECFARKIIRSEFDRSNRAKLAIAREKYSNATMPKAHKMVSTFSNVNRPRSLLSHDINISLNTCR
jgi:HKD family nuclease